MRRVLISTKPFIFVLFLVGVSVRSAESLSSAIPLGTSTKRANSKRANHGRSRLFQDASEDSTISALSQFLPVYWVSNGREELAGVTLAAPFPLTRGYERLFLPQFSSPDGEPWWNPPSTPGSQTGRSSLTPGPVLVLARPGLRSAPVLG